MPKKLTNKEFLQKLKDKGRNDIEPLEEYENMNKKMRFRCTNPDCLYEWETRPANIYYNNHSCPKCAIRRNTEANRLTENDFWEKYKNKINPNIIVLNHYTKMNDRAECACKSKGHHFSTLFSNLIKGTDCPYCAGLIADENNNVGVLYPDLLKYFKNKEDAFHILPNSSKKVYLICPDCGTEKYMPVVTLLKQGFACPVCGDGVSFPNKFVRIVLKTMGIKFKSEWSSSWCKEYKYDIFIEPNLLIEVDGEQHDNIDKGWNKYNLKNQKDIDVEKDRLAEENGYILVRIDAKISDGKYIFDNLKENKILSSNFDFSNIDYKECERKAQKSLVKEICEYYDKTKKTIKEIAETYDLSRGTVSRYLNKGAKLGFCSYKSKPKEIKIKIISKDGKEIELGSIQKVLDYLKDIEGIHTTFRTIKSLIETGENWNGFKFLKLENNA